MLFTSPNKSIIHGQSGVSAIVIVLLIMMISVLGISIISMTNIGNMVASNQLTASRAFYIAEAGIERAVREIRDDASTTQTTDDTAAGYCVTPCLDGVCQRQRVQGLPILPERFFTEPPSPVHTFYYCTLTPAAERYLQVYDFQQRYNLCGTPIKAMDIGIRASRQSGGTNTVIQLQYTLDGTWTSPVNVGSTVTISSTSTASPNFEFRTIAATPSWSNLLASSGNNFRIRAYCVSGSRSTYIDYLCIRVTTKNDAVTEPWYTTFKNSDGTHKNSKYWPGKRCG